MRLYGKLYSSVKHWNTSQGHWNDTLYGLLNCNYKCLRNLPNEKKGKRSPMVVGYLLCTKISAFFLF
ncbi:hypothetical protein FRT61_01995 [Wolbachia pipientis]|nr:hypothetical protein [Wolbachia pipientis]QEC80987.1 hypothetical protein FRT62_01995 [Wolbachia pipientis]QEC99852.1 hypothetical protein FRT63_01995 [Wolbachia pipientis]QED00975.1 hypothetical protein FRT61_01995 [Wolbachia pipientis]TLW84116.1 hypothetical protein FFT12_04275 [Wolbachia endosymbiont of Drosophila teissieri]